MKTGALILCGGQSSRMGRDKATLRFGSELMLQRVVRLVAEVVEPADIVVVAARDQQLPALPADAQIAHDELAFRGPLHGLATGLRAIADRVDAVYATGCDVPLLVPAFVRRMFMLLEEFEIAVPFDGEHHHSLAAVYRRAVLSRAQALLASGQFSPRALINGARSRMVSVEELRAVDPDLHSLKNLNREQDYLAALAIAGLSSEPTAISNEPPGPAK